MSLALSSFILVSGLSIAAILSSNILAPFQSILTAPNGTQNNGVNTINATCQVIARAMSHESLVSWPGSPDFDLDTHHWANSSTELSTCSVRPGNINDLGKIIQLIGWTQTPFAITGGGHSLNPGFSSTTGIHIAMSNFNHLQHNEDTATVDIGAGLRWDNVYDLLNPKGYTVVGGRVRGVGVAGFILGGGLSWITNEHGLTIDTLLACEIVLPNGTVTTASAQRNPDLFYGLKGGFNNFGIVTKFTLKVIPQGDIWGGSVIVPESDIERANNAIANFASNTRDPKATMNIIFDYVYGKLTAIIIVFYNAPSPPAGIFDEALSIQNSIVQVSSMPFLTLLSAGQPSNTPRRIQDEAPIQRWTPSLLNKVANETKFWGSYLEQYHSGFFFQYVVEVFLPDYYSHGPPSAWPADRSVVHFPLNVAYAWFDEKSDVAVHDALRQSIAQIRADAEAEGQSLVDASLYPNLPLLGTPIELMYGKNLERLRDIRAVYDPHRVMDLSGGWHF